MPSSSHAGFPPHSPHQQGQEVGATHAVMDPWGDGSRNSRLSEYTQVVMYTCVCTLIPPRPEGTWKQ